MEQSERGLMKSVAVFYSTGEGQTRRIAEYLAQGLRSRGIVPDCRNVKIGADPGSLRRYSAVVLAASVHLGRHQREMVRFVMAHRAELEELPAYFLSVTLSQAGVQRPEDPPEKHRQFVADVEKMIGDFCRETGWRPRHVVPVAGVLLYTQYNFLVRFIMKRIAAKAGADTDTSRDYEYTDWAALDRLVDEIAGEVAAPLHHAV
jgi:menaquinone-dependent protoporphyrinogen oxidase